MAFVLTLIMWVAAGCPSASGDVDTAQLERAAHELEQMGADAVDAGTRAIKAAKPAARKRVPMQRPFDRGDV